MTFEVGRTYRTRGGSGTVTVVGLEANGTFRCDDGFWRNGDGSFSRFTVDPRDLLPGAIEDAGGGEGGDFLQTLRSVNSARLAAWEGDQKADGLFHATELGGEVGEVLNVVKKLHREAMGWRGSRATREQLEEELGDVLICLDKLAGFYGVDLADATRRKFNATSDKVGLPHKLAAERARRGEVG
jgi:NTP pyrophosphatase (non-canonical NTP hydrolase)